MATPPGHDTFSSADVSSLSDLICEIYSDSFSADTWTTVLQLVGRVISYKKTCLLCLEPDQPSTWMICNSDEHELQHYDEHRAAIVALAERALTRGLTVWRPADAVGREEWETSEFHAFLQAQGLGDLVGVSCELGDGESAHFFLQRENTDGDFSERDIFLLRRFRHHATRAWRLRKSAHETEAAAATFRQVMRPGYICDSSGKILEMNEFGRRIIEESGNDPQSVRNVIEEEARRLIDTGLNWSHLDIFGDTARLSVHKLELPNPPLRCAVVVDSYEYFRRVLRHRMQDVGLTPREIEICLLLVKGMSNRDIAEALFIAESTVKDHLTSMFGKFGVTSRNGIVPKLLGYDTSSPGSDFRE